MEDDHRQLLGNKYEKGKLIGKGTFAKVYHGRELATGESVAIKVISKEQVKDQGMVEQIQREISATRLVRHPNIVELREVLATRSKIYYVMEYVSGGELFDKVKGNKKLKEDVARKYFQQLISAVDFCHSRGVSHRDIKPENLLLDGNDDLKITDFGFSALPEQKRLDGLLHTQCGTPAYVAPEVLRKKGYDGAKADIWSCGVVLYVLLAGFLPFHDVNLMNLYRKIFKAEYEFPPWFSHDTRKLISKILMADPERRISIEGIKRVPWYRKGMSRPHSFRLLKDKDKNRSVTDLTALGSMKKSTSSPSFFNAFELISSMSSGFDLSTLFEINAKKKVASIFTSKYSAATIVERIERAAHELRFHVETEDDFKIRMEGTEEGRKGALAVTAEVFEMTAEMTVVEFTKDSGDTLEYEKFCEEDVRPALKDIVWTWQGDDGCSSNGDVCSSNGDGEANGNGIGYSC
ncbi:Calcium/calmodulin-dependent/calcium-dependent protein kinase [Artemisia annua]|uniref:non-specific serine/threonine protein kinase n=1 Tax=Artemisia annua TaxID=35608 RepID=A0A2U1MKQ3_ARTAN|nr:Calcium/calmodulin-dependent/calcium-dependent protein kinase [Artemisia annua]